MKEEPRCLMCYELMELLNIPRSTRPRTPAIISKVNRLLAYNNEQLVAENNKLKALVKEYQTWYGC